MFLPFLISFLSFLSYKMSSSRSPSSFTAFYAHKRAAQSAVRLCGGKTRDPVPCKACSGSGSSSMEITTIGETPEPTKQTVTLSCVHCNATGKVDPIKQAYNSLVWCRCKHRDSSGFLCAADGPRVFKNTTYLCTACGFVKQFG